MSMNELLANYYGTNSAAQREELEKQAQVELFAKLAAENGLDLEQMSEEQIQHLWNETFKTASDDEDKDKDEEKKEKEKEAEMELAQQKEAQAKLAEADFLGRVMAHSYVDELQKIAGAESLKNTATRTYRSAAGAVSRAGTRAKELVTGSKRDRLQKEQDTLHRIATSDKHPESVRDRAGAALMRGRGPKDIRTERNKVYATRAGIAAGTALGGKKVYDKMKEGSAIDSLAFEAAVEKAASAGFDAEEAADRVNAVLVLGVEDSAKIASAATVEQAVDIRSLELLELAGYPVEWA